MGISAIRFSSFKKLSAFTQIPLSNLFPDIPLYLSRDQTEDSLIVLSPEEQNRLYSILGKIDDEAISEQIYQSKKAVDKLKKTSFRQTRNAFGAATGLYGALSLFLINVVCWSIAVNAIVLFVPTLLLAGIIYWRGKREEKQINQDIEAEWFDKIIAIHLKYKKIKKLRSETGKTLVQSHRILLPKRKNIRLIKSKPYKEKRHRIANPISHFIFPALAVMGMSYSFIKMGLMGCAIVAGGPVSWGIAIGLGCFTGCYFCYKRYAFLQAKIKVEKNFNQLGQQKNKLDKEIQYLENEIISQKGSYHRIFTKFIPRDLSVVRGVVDYAKTSIRKMSSIFCNVTYQPPALIVQREPGPLLRCF